MSFTSQFIGLAAGASLLVSTGAAAAQKNEPPREAAELGSVIKTPTTVDEYCTTSTIQVSVTQEGGRTVISRNETGSLNLSCVTALRNAVITQCSNQNDVTPRCFTAVAREKYGVEFFGPSPGP